VTAQEAAAMARDGQRTQRHEKAIDLRAAKMTMSFMPSLLPPAQRNACCAAAQRRVAGLSSICSQMPLSLIERSFATTGEYRLAR